MRVYPLLLKFGNASISRDSWQKLFTHSWAAPEEPRGLMLLRGEEIKGFLGLIFSSRAVRGEIERFCNMTSWIVEPDCRNHSLAMLRQAMILADATVTNFTASQGVNALLRRFSFHESLWRSIVLVPFPFARRDVEVDFEGAHFARHVDFETKKLLDDHVAQGCGAALIRHRDRACAVVLKPYTWRIRFHGVRSSVRLCRVHYASDRAIAGEFLSRARVAICTRYRALGVLADRYHFSGAKAPLSFGFPEITRTLVRSHHVDPEEVDTLYSELILLHQ